MEELNQLKLVLVKNKKTNKWLAKQLGVNQTTVSKWCTNTTQPDLATLKRISELLNVNVSEIINFD
ncbi:helix-turn-helix transcriptional regulator [uncultured Prevotella sp.]|uniref:helix-turn-helix transcriptional regulator n=1 Tax=uncultured Prevotella sp. TaxID=159272 RepID=UPI002602ADDF|nr:helix-turn-helix transcriptional regulator [uncultured Prevotella sp.]